MYNRRVEKKAKGIIYSSGLSKREKSKNLSLGFRVNNVSKGASEAEYSALIVSTKRDKYKAQDSIGARMPLHDKIGCAKKEEDSEACLGQT